jgi:hypothetical protein
MLFRVLGAPSSLSYACCSLVQTLADANYGGHALIQAVFIEDVKKSWVELDRTSPRPIVLFSDCPSSELVDLVASTRMPSLLVLDDFDECVHQVIETRDMPLPETLRFVTQSYCSLDVCRGDGVLVVTIRDGRRPLRDMLTRIAAHFGLEDPAEVAAKTLRKLGYAEDAPDTFVAHMVKSGLRITSPTSEALRENAEGRAIIKLMASQYEGVGAGQGGRRIEWPTEMFLDWDRPGGFLSGPIEMLGPARFIICGPYFHLPIGEWTAEIVIELADNPSGNRLCVDLFSGEILSGVVMPLPASGVFTFSISFRVTDPFLPVELRFQLLEGAIEGRLALRAASFVRKRYERAG